eukprot:200159-Pleurochrysis_carterae.AAC.2
MRESKSIWVSASGGEGECRAFSLLAQRVMLPKCGAAHLLRGERGVGLEHAHVNQRLLREQKDETTPPDTQRRSRTGRRAGHRAWQARTASCTVSRMMETQQDLSKLCLADSAETL